MIINASDAIHRTIISSSRYTAILPNSSGTFTAIIASIATNKIIQCITAGTLSEGRIIQAALTCPELTIAITPTIITLIFNRP